MNGTEQVWAQAEAFRHRYFKAALNALPVDVFIVADCDLRLDIIPFDDLSAKYHVDAMLIQNFTGIYVDAEDYRYLEKGPVWKQKRLRFTFAHELGHYVLHRQEAAGHTFRDFAGFFHWLHEENSVRYRIEQEANEFAGRLLVPVDRLKADYAQFIERASAVTPNWQSLPDLRHALAENLSEKYGVNSQVIEVRLDREGIWPAK